MFVWDEKKRKANLLKHKLDFTMASLVYNHPDKTSRISIRQGEDRYADTAFVEPPGACLTVIYTRRLGNIRVISLRNASREERSFYQGQSKRD